MAELDGLGALEAELPAASPAPHAVDVGRSAAAVEGTAPSHVPHAADAAAAATESTLPATMDTALRSASRSPAVLLPAASAWLPVDHRLARSPLEQNTRLPSPLAAASAATSPTSHDCFDVGPGSSLNSLHGPRSAAAFATPISSRGSGHSLREASCSPAASESRLAAASPASPGAQPAAGLRDTPAAAAADASDEVESDAGGESGPDRDAEDGTWLPELATPAQRRSGRRVRLKVCICTAGLPTHRTAGFS